MTIVMCQEALLGALAKNLQPQGNKLVNRGILHT